MLLSVVIVLHVARFSEPVLQSVNADLTPTTNTYCSVFSDPAECEKQRGDTVHKYWTEPELRDELWKTMKGLAEVTACRPLAHSPSLTHLSLAPRRTLPL